LAVVVPASVEQRIGSLFFFGLIPAAGFYAGGHLVRQMLVLGTALCEMIASRCLLCCRRLMRGLAVGVVSLARYSLLLAFVLSEKACYSLRHQCWRIYAAFIAFLCLLIRSVASFFIDVRLQHARRVYDLPRSVGKLRPLIIAGMFLAAFGSGWWVGNYIWFLNLDEGTPSQGSPIETVVDRIIRAESNGDPNARNKRSSATGLGQFIDETWLSLIRAHRPDLAMGQSQDKTLELRRDAKIAREMTLRFTEQNADMLRKRGLPVTPETLYLAHFAGGAGAVAILSAPPEADAATVMAGADTTGRTKREKIVRANPFLDRLTVADLRSWADRKMR
jgi:hypothetical protein